MFQKRRKAIRFLMAMAFAAGGANAQVAPGPFPTKPITFIVSYPAGGDTDALARLFAEKLSTRLGQSVIVDNKPGASGTIGNALVAKSPADGYTLLFSPSTLSISNLVLSTGSGASYDVISDFTPVIQIGSQSLFLVVNSSTGIRSVKDLLAAAKTEKVKTYATPGSGSPMHVLGEMFNRAAGTKMQQVPYRGAAPVVTDIVGGHIPFTYITMGPVEQHLASGKLSLVAVADAKRSPLTPQVPTLAEEGVKDVLVGAWQGVFGPKGLPADVVATLNSHMNAILKMPEVEARMKTLATLPVGGDPSVMAKLNAFDHQRFAKVIKELGIKAD